MSTVEKTAEEFLRDTAGIKPDYVTTMVFIYNYMMPRYDDRRRKKKRRLHHL